jgi:spore coat protein A, manganese oxidase
VAETHLRPTRPAGDPAGLGRRAFLGLLGGGALAFLVPGSLRQKALASLRAPANRPLASSSFARRLPIPRQLTGSEIRIPIREAEVQLLPGQKTKMWTYGGTFPGPTIRRRSGERTRVTFEHELPAQAEELTVHLHGGHSRSRFDGQPGGLTKSHKRSLYCDIPRGLPERKSGNGLLIKPGGSKNYVYDLEEDGAPERAAFQWYHDHRLDRVAKNVWHGLAGMWILDDSFERSLPLPAGERDIPLMVADRSLDRDNQLTDPFTNRRPPNDGVVGQYPLVNGAYLPHHDVAGQRYRLRLLNVSNFQAYAFALSNGRPLIQIASDSGLMPKPVRRNSVLLGPAERAEVIVDFADSANDTVELRSRPRHGPHHTRGVPVFNGPLMQFRVGGRVADSTRVPKRLRPLPKWTKHVSKQPDRKWEITVGGGFRTTWLLNGKTFNPARSDAFPALNTTETWELINKTSVSHMMHIHHNDWYMLSRNGHPPKPWEDCLKETFLLEPHDRVLVAGRFADHTGKFVIHCHMLDHEDHGLMGQFEVVKSKAHQPPHDPVARRRRAASG